MQPLNRRARRLALVLTLVSAAIVVVLASRIHHSPEPLWLDNQGQRFAAGHIYGIPLVPVRVARWLVTLGNTPVFAALVGAVVVATVIMRDRISTAVAVAACPCALLATEFIGKPLVGRTEGHSNGFPSGHATAIATVVALVALVVYRRWRGRGLLAVAPAASLVPAMGVALVRVGYHLFSDTVAGALVGGGTVVGLAWLVSSLVARRSALVREGRA